jgi:hypothetical protein
MRVRLVAVLIVACAPAAPPTRVIDPAKPAVVSPPDSPPDAPVYGKTSTAKVAALDDHVWPPPRVADEDWVAFDRPWLHKIKGAPPTFYTTSMRPDPQRVVRVQIVAIDARQVELEMAIGAEGPFPPDEKTNGKWLRNGGKLPRDAATATHVVAAFNGAFRLDKTSGGMTIRRRVFAPPLRDVASLLMHDDGRLGFGTWGPTMQTPPDVRSLRQNLDPFIDDGEYNPRGRPRWGGILKTPSSFGQRSKRTGMCRTAGGHFLYFYGNEIEAVDLGAAMKAAGCDFGLHLDMNILHVGFVFMSFEDAQYKHGHSEALSKTMGIKDTRYVDQPNPKEFFYATLRSPAGPDASFNVDAYTQPPPAWLPAIFENNTGDVHTTFVEGRRVRFAFTSNEALSGDDRDRVLAAIAVPAKDLSAISGLIADGKASAVPSELAAAIGVTARGDLVVVERAGNLATPALMVDALLKASCVRAMAATGKLERAGRDAIADGAHSTRVYVLADKPPPATYRFDVDDKGAPRWPKVKKPLK